MMERMRRRTGLKRYGLWLFTAGLLATGPADDAARQERTGTEAVIRASLHARADSPARAAVALDFVGARPGTRPEAQDRTDAVVSYFTGPRERWQTGLHTYASVIYREV